MSGGVDSSVAAALLVERGFDVIGVTMRVWPWKEADDPVRRFGSCCGSEAVDDARRVARDLGIPYYVLHMESEFDRAVIGQNIQGVLSLFCIDLLQLQADRADRPRAAKKVYQMPEIRKEAGNRIGCAVAGL